MMSLVYQLYNHIQIDTFGLFFQLNNRFEYDNLWRFDMKVCTSKFRYHYIFSRAELIWRKEIRIT